MNKYIEIIAIVEGKTEQLFIEKILAPYLGHKNIEMTVTQSGTLASKLVSFDKTG